MAEVNTTPVAGDMAYSTDPKTTSGAGGNRLTMLTNVAGAVVSLSLVLGISVWGYQLLKRDVSGIPVVRAAAGEMRVRPEEPGGQLALHQGLSVNAVAARGVAAAPADELRLAPSPVDLTAEDRIMPAAMVAETQQAPPPEAPATAPPDVAAALQSGDVEGLVDQLTAGIAPLEETLEGPATEEVIATLSDDLVEAPTQAAPSAVLEGPGVRQSLRPRKRPAVRAQVTPEAPAAGPQEIDAASLPAGTRLAQLGAFDSAEVAREQWDLISSRFMVYMQGKQRVVQKASSGGRSFYRLRAMGFEDIADARRFCSALVAENADCIPVVTR